jgi:glycosyltransferase involved in cell wall biosynthesis
MWGRYPAPGSIGGNTMYYDVHDYGDIFAGRVGRPTVSVIIPALNEAENLPHVLPRIPDWVDEVLLVDGYSHDGTVEVACDLRGQTRIVKQHGRGKGAAIRSGFAAARGDIVVLLDADGSTDPAEIPAFVGALLSGADFAKGSRFIQGARTDDMPLIRKLANGPLTTLANLITGAHYTDITYGYNATWRKHAGALGLDINGWANEIITNLRAARNGLRVVEVASYEHDRIAGQAKLVALPAGWTILKAMLREPFRKHPPPKDGLVTEQSILGLNKEHSGQPLVTWECDHEAADAQASASEPVGEPVLADEADWVDESLSPTEQAV